jgi:hypothetical protein
MGRRDSNDPQWAEAKRKVRERDKGQDRILSILTYKEFLILKENAPSNALQTLDPAHVFSVGAHSTEVYNVDNIVTLNRFSHTSLDDMKSPISGEGITREERDLWWERIAGSQWSKIQHLNGAMELEE